jgi:hypothetical protein
MMNGFKKAIDDEQQSFRSHAMCDAVCVSPFLSQIDNAVKS